MTTAARKKEAQKALEKLLSAVDSLRQEHEDEANRSGEPAIRVDRCLLNHVFDAYKELMR